MIKIKLRTKFEIIGALLFIALLVAVSAESVTRTITDSTDNSYTLIRNSNGKYWAATGDNLQIAINDLGSGGGTVWVGSDITLTTTLKLNRSYITIDFESHKVTLGSDITFINVSSATPVIGSTVQNVHIDPISTQTKDIISLYLPPNAGWANRIWSNLFENIIIGRSDLGGNHNYIGIHLYIDVGAYDPMDMASFFGNTFRHITMYNPNTAILLESDNTDAWGNANNFEDILVWAYVTGVEFKIDPSATGKGFSQGVFDNVKMQTADYSKDAFKNIDGNGNHFTDCLVWDWYAATSPNHEWSIDSNAEDTYINVHYIIDILDNSQNTKIVDPLGRTEHHGATIVADGGTISHGLYKTPTVVVCTCSVSGQMVSVTALGPTTFTVAIKKYDGSAGTTQKIYWYAWV